jgi:hypothetical protein
MKAIFDTYNPWETVEILPIPPQRIITFFETVSHSKVLLAGFSLLKRLKLKKTFFFNDLKIKVVTKLNESHLQICN